MAVIALTARITAKNTQGIFVVGSVRSAERTRCSPAQARCTARRRNDVLVTLHEADAIGLDADLQIAVAYPFSPRRHVTGCHWQAGSRSGRCAPSTRSACRQCSTPTR